MKEFTAIIGVLLTWVCLLPEHLPAQGPNVEGDEESRPESDAPIIARAGDQVPAKAKPSVELQRLQGTWEGFQVGDQAKVRITITGQSLHFHRDKNFWF